MRTGVAFSTRGEQLVSSNSHMGCWAAVCCNLCVSSQLQHTQTSWLPEGLLGITACRPERSWLWAVMSQWSPHKPCSSCHQRGRLPSKCHLLFPVCGCLVFPLLKANITIDERKNIQISLSHSENRKLF